MRDLGFIQIKLNELINTVKQTGSTSSSASVLASIDLNTSDSKIVLDNILAELQDDISISETVWYDKTDITKFYVRKTTVNQDTQVITIDFQNIDGSSSTPIITNLIQTVANSDIEIVSTLYEVVTNNTGYSLGDIVEELKLINTTTNLVTSIYYNKTSSTIISPVFSHLILLSRESKESTQLLVKSNTDNLNVLLSTRASESTLSALNTKVIITTDGIKVDGSAIVQPISATTLPLPTGASTSALQTTQDTSINLLLKPASTLFKLSTLDTITNALPVGTNSIGQVTANAGTNLNTSALSLEATQLLLKAKTDNIDVLLSTRLKPSDTLTKVATVDTITNALPIGANVIGKVSIDQTLQGTTNFITSNLTQIGGTAIATNVGINNAGTQRVTIATDNLPIASNITQIQSLPIATSNGLVTSNTERIVLANRIETISGAIGISTDFVPTSGQRIKSLLFTNNTVATIFLQIHNKASALILGDVPLNGMIIRVPANSTLDKTVADYGEAGILYGANTRIGLSSTFDTYTAITPLNTSINIITVI